MPFRIMKFKRGQVVESACTYQSTAVVKEGCDSYRTCHLYTRASWSAVRCDCDDQEN
jgi:hypothetical protein